MLILVTTHRPSDAHGSGNVVFTLIMRGCCEAKEQHGLEIEVQLGLLASAFFLPFESAQLAFN
jgi:hypothetical protein